MIPTKETSLIHLSGYRFAHRLLAACLLVGSATGIPTTATATPTILAQNQGNVHNIIVDNSRVYWINSTGAAVSSVDKINGGTVRIHSPSTKFCIAGTCVDTIGGDIVQDTANLYFVTGAGGGDIGFNSGYDVYRVPKASSGATLLTPSVTYTPGSINPNEKRPGKTCLGIANGSLYYFSGYQTNPLNPSGVVSLGMIERISTSGGTPQEVIPFSVDTNTTGDINPNHFSTSNYLCWSNISSPLGISKSSLLPGGTRTTVATATRSGAVSSPTGGPAAGWIFWLDSNTTFTSTALRRLAPGTTPVTLLTGLTGNDGQSSFVVVGNLVYCITATGAIVSVPIYGGSAVPVVSAVDALLPYGLTSDGLYLYWATYNGQIRRVSLPVLNFTITVNPLPSGGGTVWGEGFYPYGSTATVIAHPNTGYSFKSWTENNVTVFYATTYAFTVTKSRILDANFSISSGPPIVATNLATNVASFSATLNGTVNSRGLTTSVHFQYGTTTGYGLNTANQSKTGTTDQNVSANIGSLSASTTYHFRIVATNSAGTTYGGDRTFTTL